MMKPTPGFPIDLSALTETEIDQFRNDPSTLLNGEIPVCLYLRFSSDKQKEQSIEGQPRLLRTKRLSYCGCLCRPRNLCPDC